MMPNSTFAEPPSSCPVSRGESEESQASDESDESTETDRASETVSGKNQCRVFAAMTLLFS